MKVLIGITCYNKKQYIIDRFIDSIRKIDYKGEYDILFVDNSKGETYAEYIRSKGFEVIRSDPNFNTTQERLTEAYNVLREWFLEDKSYTYLLSIEQDILVPKDVIQRLLKHNKLICSGLYYLGKKPCVMTGKVVPTPPNKLREFRFEKYYYRYDFIKKEKLDQAIKNKELIKAYCVGLGCLLIKRKILKRLKFRIAHNGNLFKAHNDMYFSMDCRSRKIDIFLDPTIKCEHDNLKYRDC